jgi:hypothetical protein
VPVNLLDVLLALVDKQKLRGNLERLAVGAEGGGALLVVLLDREVPERDLVVGSRGGKNRRVSRVPLDRGDGRSVPCEVGDGRGGAGDC